MSLELEIFKEIKGMTLSKRKAYLKELEKEPIISLEQVFTFDIDNLTKEEKDLLILEAEVFNEERRRKSKEYRLNNIEYFREKNKQWELENKEKRKEIMKKYYETHSESKTCFICNGKYKCYNLRGHIGTKKHIEGLKKLGVREEASRLE